VRSLVERGAEIIPNLSHFLWLESRWVRLLWAEFFVLVSAFGDVVPAVLIPET